MIRWRSVLVDLKFLSNGVMIYGIFYSMGFLAFFIQLGESNAKGVTSATPLLALSVCVATHIANERADHVADRIVVEHGGYKRRLAVRMVSIFIFNFALVTAGNLTVCQMRGWEEAFSPFWILSALAIILVFSTAGVVVAGAFPHPIASVALTMVLLFAGGAAPTDSFQSSTFIHMISSNSLPEWARSFLPFALFWFFAAIVLSPLALGRRLPLLRLSRNRATGIKFPSWMNWPSNFSTRTFLSAITNWLPFFGLLAALGCYTYSALLVAAKYADLQITGPLFAIFPGLILVNVLPAILLSKSLHGHEAQEQESFLFETKGQALRSRMTQIAVVIAVASMFLLTLIAGITKTELSSQSFLRSIVLAVVSSPGLAAAGILVGDRLRSTPGLVIVSFMLTLPELVISKLFPALDPWLPSSIFSALSGGGPFIVDQSSILNFWVALVVMGFLLGLPALAIISYGRRGARVLIRLKVSA